MAILEQVIRMKNQGISDGDIINELSQQGVSPREINDALKQAQIKYAISNTDGEGEEMQPSIMPEEEVPSPGQTYTPRVPIPEQYAPQEESYQPQEYQEQYPQQEQYYQPGEYEQVPAGIDTDTIMEIADQIFSDRIKKIQKQTDTVTEVSALMQTKVENVSERLKKMETIIDRLQIAILEKVGSYGKNLEGIKKEMSMMQDSFSKMISPSRKTERRREEYSAPEENETTEEEEASDLTREAVNPVTSRVRRQEIVSKPQKKISKRK